MSHMVLNPTGDREGMLESALRLADTPVALGGWQEYFGEGVEIEDEMTRANTAMLLENAKWWLASQCGGRRVLDSDGRWRIDEATRSALVGGFSDYLFPVIRAGFPTNPISEIVSVQPTPRRTATIVYWNWIVGTTKGSYVQGQRLFDANTGKQSSGFNFSNETIDQEPIAALGSAGATVAGTLTFNDGGGIRPGTVKLTITTTSDGVQTFLDNGNGEFLNGTSTIASSLIDYSTGQFSVTLGASETFSTAATNFATYAWDSEGSKLLPEVDIQIVTSTAETETRKLKINYSMESMQDIMAEFGVSLEPQLVQGAAEQMNDEIARQIIHEIWRVAPVNSTFAKTPPGAGSPQYTQQQHFMDLIVNLNQASNNIQFRTRKGYGNFIVADEGACTLLESLPGNMFVAAPRPANVQGLHFVGTLIGKFRVYKDLRLVNEPGASQYGNILMGFKGNQFYEAGLVWSPYQLLYTTPSLQTADFITQKGMASRYATKMVNPDMYVRINLGA